MIAANEINLDQLAVDASFRIMAKALPSNCNYSFFAALSKLDGLHLEPNVGVRLCGLDRSFGGVHYPSEKTRLKLRIMANQAKEMSRYIGKQIEVDNYPVVLSNMNLEIVLPSEDLVSDLVVISRAMTIDTFRQGVDRKLAEMGISNVNVDIPTFENTKLQRRVVKIKNKYMVGYSLRITGLDDADATKLLINGLGGRRHMGCGIFRPFRGLDS